MSRHRSSLFSANMNAHVKTGLKFLIGIGAFYTLFWIIISSLALYFLKSFIAGTSNWLLQILGVPAQLFFGAGMDPSIIVGLVTAQITNLCAGDFEIILLFAIILATWDRTWRKRFWGCVFGFITIMILNPLRVFTVLAVGHYSSWVWADFTHDILFRLMLLIVIVVYYFIWYVKYDIVSENIKSLINKVKPKKSKLKREG